MQNINLTAFSLLLILTFFSCTEPYALKTSNYDEALVIEATITNELKHQEIKVTKTYRLEQNGPTVVSNAVVIVSDNMGNSYEFTEISGIYVSLNEFQAQSNVQYQLKIITEDGKTYISSNEILTQVSPIQNLVPTVTSKNGEKGVEIFVQSNDPTNNSRYYRFEYEETNKIIAPMWVPVKAIVTYNAIGTNPPGTIDLVPRTSEARVCYSTKKSTDLFLLSTNNLLEDDVNYSIRFIKKSDYIIANRYSILVKQYVQNLASYTYNKTLKELSSSGNILSQNQPGFISGNIKRIEDPNEKVIGYFEVSSVSSKRIFFNFNDILSGEITPAYPYQCEIDPNYTLSYCFDPFPSECNGSGYFLLKYLSNGNMLYYAYIDTKYELVQLACGDCTSFSSNIKPLFWID